MPSRRLLRRTAVVALGVVAVGEAATGVVAAHHQRAVLAEARAGAAYVTAVRPVADRVYDAVQPIQDALDALATRRPGVHQATDDVVLRSGVLAALQAAQADLAHLAVPSAYATEAGALETAIDSLLASVGQLQVVVRTAGRASEACSACPAAERFAAAVTGWQLSLVPLSPVEPLSSPGPRGGVRSGARAPTMGGFIHAADLICASSTRRYALLPHAQPASFPKAAAILRSTVAALTAVPVPARAGLDRQLQARLQGAVSLATTMEKLDGAYRRNNSSGYAAGLLLLEEQLRTIDAVSKAYRAHGVSACAAFFTLPERELRASFSI